MCFLVDTYNTLKSGVPTAIKVAKELGDKINFIGIRLDSGDIAFLSKEARRMLDAAGFHDAKIIVSNDLDEYTILNLKSQGAKVDVWGIGTKLITAYDQPALGAVYKMVAIENSEGQLEDTIKISANAEKVSTPGLKMSIVLSIKRMERQREITSQCTMKILKLRNVLKCSIQFIRLSQSLSRILKQKFTSACY